MSTEPENQNESVANPIAANSEPETPNSPGRHSDPESDLQNSEFVIECPGGSNAAQPSAQPGLHPPSVEPEPSPVSAPAPLQNSELEIPNSKFAAGQPPVDPALVYPRGRGRIPKVADLPPAIIEHVNEQLLRRVPYFLIVEDLKERGYPGFNQMNISNWTLKGYKHWLDSRMSIIQQNAQREAALNYARKNGCTLSHALHQLGLHNLYQLANSFNLSTVAEKFKDEPEPFLKLNKEISTFLKLDKDRNQIVPAPKEIQPTLLDAALRPEGTGGLTDEERDAAAARIGIFPYEEPASPPPSIDFSQSTPKPTSDQHV